MRWLALIALSSCASMMQPIPGHVFIAECKRGTASSYKGELICDFEGTPAVSRPLEPNETAMSACLYCDRWRF